MTLTDRVRKLDIFKKVPQDFSEGTNAGGLISILTATAILFFLFREITLFFNPNMVAQIRSDQLITRKQMAINLDITFPKFPCELISLDIQDVMMSHSPNIGSIQKYRLNKNGQRLDDSDFQLLREPNQARQFEMAKTAFDNFYGCRIKGSFTVKEVPGNFHISAHGYQNIFAKLKVDGVVNTLDVSHIIHNLYFGDISNIVAIEQKHPESVLTKLKSHSKIYDMTETQHSYTSHYHLDIVPTLYHDNYFGATHAYQYTYNHNTFEVYHMPALYFNYHIGGLVVDIVADGSGIGMILVRICAVIGGIYALAGFVDHAIDGIGGERKKQYELIK